MRWHGCRNLVCVRSKWTYYGNIQCNHSKLPLYEVCCNLAFSLMSWRSCRYLTSHWWSGGAMRWRWHRCRILLCVRSMWTLYANVVCDHTMFQLYRVCCYLAFSLDCWRSDRFTGCRRLGWCCSRNIVLLKHLSFLARPLFVCTLNRKRDDIRFVFIKDLLNNILTRPIGFKSANGTSW